MPRNPKNTTFNCLAIITAGFVMDAPLVAAETPEETAAVFSASASGQFCVALQQVMAGTKMTGENTVFDSMAPYRHSKPSIEPLQIYQVVTYAKQLPIVVSCKMKTAAHIRAAYGSSAAGEQKYCPDAARALQQQVVMELRRDGRAEAADKAAAFVIDETEPYITGQAYLKDFVPIYRGPDGAIHVNSPGLYQNYDSWYTFLLPEIVKGQSYCHLATTELMRAIASGEIEPDITVTTADNAQTRPQ